MGLGTRNYAISPGARIGTDAMRTTGKRTRRARLLAIARAVQWLGVVWNFVCWGYAVWELQRGRNLSDAIGNAIPLFLLGGIGFAAAFFVAWVLKKRARRKSGTHAERPGGDSAD